MCIDRNFLAATVLAVAAIPMSLFGFFASFNAVANDGKWGPEKLGVYTVRDDGGLDDDNNNGWRWCVAWSLAAVLFILHYGMQKVGYIEGPVEEKQKAVGDEKPVKLAWTVDVKPAEKAAA